MLHTYLGLLAASHAKGRLLLTFRVVTAFVVSHVDHSIQSMHNAHLGLLARYGRGRLLRAVLMAASLVPYVEHPIQSMLHTHLGPLARYGIGRYGIGRPLCRGRSLVAPLMNHVDHLVQSMFGAHLSLLIRYAIEWPFGAGLGLHPVFTRLTIPSEACSTHVSAFLPAIAQGAVRMVALRRSFRPKYAPRTSQRSCCQPIHRSSMLLLRHVGWLHLLWTTLIIPS